MVKFLRVVAVVLALSYVPGFTAASEMSSLRDGEPEGPAQAAVEAPAEHGSAGLPMEALALEQDYQDEYTRLRDLALAGQSETALQGLDVLLQQDIPAGLRVRIYATAISIAANIEDWTRAFGWLSDAMPYLPEAKEEGALLLSAAGYLYALVGETKMGLGFGRRALALADAGSDAVVQCRVLAMLALAVEYGGDYVEAEQLRRRQIETCTRAGEVAFVATATHGVSQALARVDRHAEALRWAEQSVAQAEAAGSWIGVNNGKLAIARSLVALKQEPARAEALLTGVRQYWREQKAALSLAETEQAWADLDESTGDLAGALTHLKATMRHSHETERNARERQLAYLQVRFDTQRKEQTIALLEAEKSLSELAVTATQRRQLLLIVGLAGLLITAALLSILLRRTFRDRQHYRWTSEHDGLTGLYNHEKVCELGEVGFARARDSGQAFTAIVLDIDAFKSVNDHYGHAAGDEALHTMGAWISEVVGHDGISGRRGGDEFTILLEADTAAAKATLDRLRKLIQPVSTLGEKFGFSISAGVCQAGADVTTLEQLLHQADQALYRAKHEGGDRVVCADEAALDTSTANAGLVVVGSGIQFGRHVSERTLSEIRRAEVVLCLADPFALAMIQSFCPGAINLGAYYAPGKDRRETYREIDAAIMAEVRAGKRVCAVFYGHPGVFADVPHRVVRKAREEGFAARMEPGISAEACLYADLGIDPGHCGVQSMEATQFMFYDRRLDPCGVVLLWQVALAGDLSCTRLHAEPEGLQALVDKLLRWYPPEHEAILYEAAQLPIDSPRAERLRLRDLPTAHYQEFTTLVIPPLGELQPDPDSVLRTDMA